MYYLQYPPFSFIFYSSAVNAAVESGQLLTSAYSIIEYVLEGCFFLMQP